MLTGGWQTSRETAYVQATRARNGTDWYLARDQLGEEGQEPDRIASLARQMSNSRAHEPSILHPEIPDRGWSPLRDPLRIAELTLRLNPLGQAQQRDSPEHDVDYGYER